MCSILGVFDLRPDDDLAHLRPLALACSARQRHRGPDWSGVLGSERGLLVHERLAIVDPAGGAQPIVSADGGWALAVNGEIYNHRGLRESFPDWAWQTGSDCEVILPLWLGEGREGLQRLNGMFAFALLEPATGRWVVARDPVGVIPLYWGRDAEGRMWVASELKALVDRCPNPEPFPPGHVFDSAVGRLEPFRPAPWRTRPAGGWRSPAAPELREAFEAAVHRQLMGDVPYGVLLSGGLDSSLVAATAARYARRRVDEDDRSEAWWPRLHSFAIGLEGAPDLRAAEQVAAHLGTAHHGFTYRLEEGIDALPDVIRHIESYDVTTVRASTPMFLLARRIRAMGVKMVLSGEGADEVFGGYLYFHKAPSPEAFHEETVRKVEALHQFDCLRANKSMAAWGVEARVPFLDLDFLDLAMSVDPALRMPMAAHPGGPRVEKALLRSAFEGVLPPEILWRQKEQFSDGVGYGWIDGLKAHAEAMVSEEALRAAPERFPIHPPTTREGYLYRELFERFFPGAAAAQTVPGGPSIACSSPAALAWDPSFQGAADPSGRSVAGVHQAGYTLKGETSGPS